MTANLPMGSNIITGHGTPSVSTDVPNKGYVDGLVSSFFSTGDVKLTLKNVADSGWVMCSDSGIGSAASGATFASATAQALFLLIYNNITDAWAPVYTSAGVISSRAAQGSAATAWAANSRLVLPSMLGRALAIAGSGSGLTARTLGGTIGEETHLLTTAEIPAHSHANSLNDPGHTHTLGQGNSVGSGVGAASSNPTIGFASGGISSSTTGITITNVNAGGGGAHNNMQPTTFLNAMIKL